MTGEKLHERVVELFTVEKKQIKEIAKQLAVSPARVERILDRYRKRDQNQQ